MLSGAVQKIVDEFFAEVSPDFKAYGDAASFSYVALQSGDNQVLLQGTVWLNVNQPVIPFATFKSHTLRAGHFLLKDVTRSIDEFIRSIFSGEVPTPDGPLLFKPNGSSALYGARYDPFYEAVPKSQRRMARLSIFAAEYRDFLDRPKLDWELRAARVPYDGLADLLAVYQPGALSGVSSVDIVAFNLSAVDAGSSSITANKGTIAVRKAPFASEKKVSVGYRVFDKSKIVARGHVEGDAINWNTDAAGAIGKFEMDIPEGAIIHVFANYGGNAQHHYYLGDQSRFQNPRRAIYEAFDPQFALMKEVLAKSSRLHAPSRDFEACMSCLFWLLGFATAHIGTLITEGPDIIVATPNGHIAILECTTGAIDAGKVAKVHARAQAVRTALNLANSQHVRVLPVMVTSITRDEALPGIENAETNGILVLTRTEIENLIARTLVPGNADLFFEEGERTANAARERIQGSGN